jgi:opacity protein-like surface antigen
MSGAGKQPLRTFALPGILALAAAAGPPVSAAAAASAPVRIAVFEFELEDATPAATYLGGGASSAALMTKVSSAARQELAQSGRYSVIDASRLDAKLLAGRSLSRCGGCEAGIALQLGAEQSMIGIVKKVTQTDYYVVVRIRDARTGKLLDQQEANFAGSAEGYASGVRMLIRHQILAAPP